MYVATGSPEVPIRVYTDTMLSNNGLLEKVSANYNNFAANVAGVVTYVVNGGSDAGVVYRTDVLAAGSSVLGVAIPDQQNVVAHYPIAELASSLVVGDPHDAATEVGPLVAQRQQERVEKYIALGQEEGARVVVGGNGMPAGIEKGWYVQPTVFADATNQMRIAREEIFGPVLSVLKFSDLDELVRRANATTFGLAAAVWTRDVARAHEVAKRLRAGTVWVNCYDVFDAAAPFGGFKQSGYGRDLSIHAFDKFTGLKTTWIRY